MGTTIERGYLEDPLNTWPLDAGVAESVDGWQFTANLTSTVPSAFQLLGQVEDFRAAQGIQFDGIIDDGKEQGATQFTGSILGTIPIPLQFFADLTHRHSEGIQFLSDVSTLSGSSSQFTAQPSGLKPCGAQFHGVLTHSWPVGSQFSGNILDFQQALGTSFMQNSVLHMEDSAYLIDDYLTESYLVSQVKAIASWQFLAKTENKVFASGLQFEGDIAGSIQGATQFEGTLESTKPLGAQFHSHIQDFLKSSASQFKGIIEKQKGGAIQFTGHIEDFESAFGGQFTAYVVSAMGGQFRAALYNLTNLRVLVDFASRGVSPTNWTASTTASGDFSAANLNTDIVEQVWRGGLSVKVGVTLDCDTGVPQGVFNDTLAILNHNLTTSANVEIVGANAPDFSGAVTIIRPQMSLENTYWVAPTLPMDGYRYWRFSISDVTNQNDYLQIGAILFGESVILHGENYSDPIRYRKTHFSDKVETEGFTSAQNDRGIKRSLSIDFKSLNANGGNYANLSDVFQRARTNLKCLWIPTPKYPGRYAVFAKLVQLPEESHIDNGENANYADLTLEMDEAK